MERVFGTVEVTWGEDDDSKYVLTQFQDGTHVMARPIEEEWDKTRLHDPLHSWLAHRLGMSHSPSLWRVAHPGDTSCPDWQLAYEETAVMALQEYLSLTGFDHVNL